MTSHITHSRDLRRQASHDVTEIDYRCSILQYTTSVPDSPGSNWTSDPPNTASQTSPDVWEFSHFTILLLVVFLKVERRQAADNKWPLILHNQYRGCLWLGDVFWFEMAEKCEDTAQIAFYQLNDKIFSHISMLSYLNLSITDTVM